MDYSNLGRMAGETFLDYLLRMQQRKGGMLGTIRPESTTETTKPTQDLATQISTLGQMVRNDRGSSEVGPPKTTDTRTPAQKFNDALEIQRGAKTSAGSVASLLPIPLFGLAVSGLESWGNNRELRKGLEASGITDEETIDYLIENPERIAQMRQSGELFVEPMENMQRGSTGMLSGYKGMANDIRARTGMELDLSPFGGRGVLSQPNPGMPGMYNSAKALQAKQQQAAVEASAAKLAKEEQARRANLSNMAAQTTAASIAPGFRQSEFYGGTSPFSVQTSSGSSFDSSGQWSGEDFSDPGWTADGNDWDNF